MESSGWKVVGVCAFAPASSPPPSPSDFLFLSFGEGVSRWMTARRWFLVWCGVWCVVCGGEACGV